MQAQGKSFISQSTCEVLMSHSLRRSLKKQDKTLSDAIKGTVIEKIVRNLKQNVMLSSPAETFLKDAEAQVELIQAPNTVITAVKMSIYKLNFLIIKWVTRVLPLQ